MSKHRRLIDVDATKEKIKTIMKAFDGIATEDKPLKKIFEKLEDVIITVIDDMPTIESETDKEAYERGYKKGRDDLEGYIQQLRWERDTAIHQLEDLGYGFCEDPKWSEAKTQGKFTYCRECRHYGKRYLCDVCLERVYFQ